jgi:hypothetical protein
VIDDRQPSRLWTRSQVQAVAAVNAVGAALIVTSYAVCAGLSTLHGQIPWINLAVVGVAIAGSANAALLFFARRAFRVRFGTVTAVVSAVTAPVPAAARPRDAWVRVARGGSLVHRPDCPFVHDRPTRRVDAATVRDNDPRRCGVCAR